jgi:hypothetical protein|tara:strand:+ start:140 stop:391 length:252 start_codon:yes stop_codon:yes gene_type:complete
MKDKVKKQIEQLQNEQTFFITYYAKKHREIITRKGKIDQTSRVRGTWVTPKGNYCFCYYDLDAETLNPYRTATNPLKIEKEVA